MAPTIISLNINGNVFATSTLPVAKPLTIIVDDCVPIFPPIPIITGINAASIIICSRRTLKYPIIAAAQIPPKRLANIQGARDCAFSKGVLSKISRSLPTPAICRKSSEASSLIISTTSSIVTIPKNLFCLLTIGRAR